MKVEEMKEEKKKALIIEETAEEGSVCVSLTYQFQRMYRQKKNLFWINIANDDAKHFRANKNGKFHSFLSYSRLKIKDFFYFHPSCTLRNNKNRTDQKTETRYFLFLIDQILGDQGVRTIRLSVLDVPRVLWDGCVRGRTGR